MYNKKHIFVILGNDGRKLVRNACAALDRSVWFLIYLIFKEDAVNKRWVSQGRVAKNLFTDNGLKCVAARWDDFERARLEHNSQIKNSMCKRPLFLFNDSSFCMFECRS